MDKEENDDGKDDNFCEPQESIHHLSCGAVNAIPFQESSTNPPSDPSLRYIPFPS
jgi:hypothetical protein